MNDTEKVILEESTKKANLEAISKWGIGQMCPTCKGKGYIGEEKAGVTCPECEGVCYVGESEPCEKCQGGDPQCGCCSGTGFLKVGKHPAATRATRILAVKFAAKEIELYQKLLLAGKFHASFIVIGALSSRMAGADGLNAQGIKHTKEVRQMFPLLWPGYLLCGGDFSSFEVTIADAVCNDEALRAELIAGRKIHALFGMAIFPGTTYEEVKSSDGSTTNDMYTKGKQGFFGTMLYGGDHSTLVNRLGISEEVAKVAIESFGSRFVGVKKWRKRVADSFCSMSQPGGIGTKVVWKDPADYAETMLGFRRYFTLENRIARAVFNLACKPPTHWKNCQVKVVRRDRVQTAGGAVASALYGAAFAMQAANMRAAANHEIQSPGAEITKHVQRKIWDLQPVGVNDWHVAPMNIHDEIMCVTRPDTVPAVTQVVRDSVEHFRPYVPLIGMDWCEGMNNWAEKKSGATQIKIRAPEMMK
jgi:DNA polymerase I-like protein with 3'-5' exonuclease and polymerase domains